MKLRQNVPSDNGMLERLSSWDIVDIGLHPEGSNYVFVVRMENPEAGASDDSGGEPLYAVYKPRVGERPLRDFPIGSLHRRERAAYILARSLGWPLIPPTVIREGPYGVGSMQLFIEADIEDHYFTLRDAELEVFEPIAAFDVLVNNADRKGSSCLKDSKGNIWAIDHGLTFNPLARQRTVMHEFSGGSLPGWILASLRAFEMKLGERDVLVRELDALLDPGEVDGLRARLRRMSETGMFPVLDPYSNVPWPLL